MNFIIGLALCLNIAMIISYVTIMCTINNERLKPVLRANIGATTTALFVLYTLFCLIVSLFGVLLQHDYIYLSFLFFVFAPFAIGKFLEFKTLKICSMAQLMLFITSSVFLYYLIH